MSLTLPFRHHVRAPRATAREVAGGTDAGALVRSADGPVLLVSSSGGHLAELARLVEHWGLPRAQRHWVAPRTTQTEGALAGDPVTWVRPVESRQLARAGLNLSTAQAVHHRVHPAMVVSAGAAQAVPHLVVAGLHRTPVVYVESVARLDDPSLTGRVAMRLPGAHLFNQGPAWGGRWRSTDDVYAGLRVVRDPVRSTLGATDSAGTAVVRRAVVALGTEHFGFRRAVDEARTALAGCPEVTWQVGTTDYQVDGAQLGRWLPPSHLEAAMRASDAVVVHGGAGSILAALLAGRVPVAIARTASLGEHCDDHQLRMCEGLAERGLCLLVRPGEHLGPEHLAQVAGLRVEVDRSAALPAAQAS